MEPVRRAYLELHIAVLLFGLTAILGKLITLSAIVLVWWRVLITCLSLVFLLRKGNSLHTMPRSDMLRFAGIGIIIALHWLTFYGAIKLSNASITLICLATISFFTALMEPLFMRHRIRWYELMLGVAIIPGMWLVTDSVDVRMTTGIWVGLISAFLASVFAILNKKMIHKADSLSITFVELSSSWIFISLLLPFFFHFKENEKLLPAPMDWLWLLILALLCTTLAYVLSLRALRHLSAFAANLTVNLEPVYGILLAWLLLRENKDLPPGFYGGVAIILAAVMTYPLLRKKFAPPSSTG